MNSVLPCNQMGVGGSPSGETLTGEEGDSHILPWLWT